MQQKGSMVAVPWATGLLLRKEVGDSNLGFCLSQHRVASQPSMLDVRLDQKVLCKER